MRADKDRNEVIISPDDPEDHRGRLKRIGGSASDNWNNVLVNQAAQTLWLNHSDKEEQARQASAMVAALTGLDPRDELEAMIAAQMLGAITPRWNAIGVP